MNKTENLLVTTMEECAEIQQNISKALRFGLYNERCIAPETTNESEILLEYYQLSAMIELLQENDILKRLSDDDIKNIMKSKKEKVKMYMEVSRSKGLLVDIL